MPTAFHPEPGDPAASPKKSLARSVLVVDDENGVRDLMSRWLQAGGFSVASASGAIEALGLMQTYPPAVALCDIRMPGRDGLWLADRIRQQFPETALIMASGMHDAGDAVASLGEGVVGYLLKPFGSDRLRDAVTRGIEWHLSARDSRWWREKLEREVSNRHSRLAEAIATLNGDATVEAMLSTLTIGNEEAYAHACRVAALAVEIAEVMDLPQHEVAIIRQAALLHDLGKLAMPEALLGKPAPLSSEERSIIRRHPELGSELISGLLYLEEAAEMVRDTHERPDGLGYPARLRASDVSLGARIIAVADAYDTMLRARVYRGSLSVAEALLELDRCSGSQFDIEVVTILKWIVAID